MPNIKNRKHYQSEIFKVWDKRKRGWLDNRELEDNVIFKFEYGRAWAEVKDHDRCVIVPPMNDAFEMLEEVPLTCNHCHEGIMYPVDASINVAGNIFCPECKEFIKKGTLKQFLDVSKPAEDENDDRVKCEYCGVKIDPSEIFINKEGAVLCKNCLYKVGQHWVPV